MAKIITGHIGVDHITSDDVSSFQKGLVGARDYLLSDNPDDFVATINANGTISLCDADIIIQGTHARIYFTDVVTLEPGTSGVTRIDSIVAKYTRDEKGIENVDVFAKTGTSEPPELEQTDIRGAGTVREVALWNITIDGNVPNTPSRVIPVVNSLDTVQNLICSLKNKVDNLSLAKSAQDENISELKNIIAALQKTVDEKLTNKVFTSPLSITNKGVSGEIMYADLQAYVSTYDDKTGANDVTAYRIALCDRNHTEKTFFAFYSNGNRGITIDGKFYDESFIQKGYVSITPKSTGADEKIGDVVVGGTRYTVTQTFYKNTVTVTFPKAYGSAPTVLLTPITTVGHNCHCGVTDVTSQGFKIHLERTTTTVTGVYWVAFGKF